MDAKNFSDNDAWVDTARWTKWLKEKNIVWSYGDRQNQTDGEEHYVLKYRSRDNKLHVFNMNCNRWSWSDGWQEGINWVEEQNKNTQKRIAKFRIKQK